MLCFVVSCVYLILQCLLGAPNARQCYQLRVPLHMQHTGHKPTVSPNPPTHYPQHYENVINICSCFHFHDGHLYPGSGLSTVPSPNMVQKFFQVSRQQYKYCTVQYPFQVHTWTHHATVTLGAHHHTCAFHGRQIYPGSLITFQLHSQ